jgi:hypothetical protein
VSVDPNSPDYLPTLKILDLHAEKAFKLGRQYTVRLVVDGFNLLNSNVPIDMSVIGDGYGRVTQIPQGRRWRMGLRFQF